MAHRKRWLINDDLPFLEIAIFYSYATLNNQRVYKEYREIYGDFMLWIWKKSMEIIGAPNDGTFISIVWPNSF
jgi:hypothetical protein